MCGICGAFGFRDGRPVDPSVIATMGSVIEHRGPDDQGAVVEGPIGLGFRRLSIVDLDGGNQPIGNEDDTIRVVCNGEIYDYRTLRDELLALGHRFRTGSDAEVLVHLYEEHGDRLLERINGQFAFALFDTARHRLLLARDHFGVAPLFHTLIDGTFVFASEIKAILAYPGVARRVDLTGLDQVLSLPGLVSPRTMFEGIQSLPPGHCLTVDREGIQTRAYWDLVYPRADEASAPQDEAAWIEELDAALHRSVRRRLQGDVTVGAYLSGGLDSSLVTALMTRERGGGVETFSIAFDDAMFDETSHQRLVAERLGCARHAVHFDTDAIGVGLRDAVWHAECPIRESYNTASLALSRAARTRGVPVVLSGEGADELFAGYTGYRFDAFRRERGACKPLAPRESELRRRLWGDEAVFYENDLESHERDRLKLYAPTLRNRFDDFDFSRLGLVDTARLKGIHHQHQRSYLDMRLRLGDHLVGDHGDRMLLANAVEGRFPFLDIEVADVARRMPPDLKLNGQVEKYALKQVARRYLPASIVDREKFAFNTPGSAYLLRARIDWVEELLSPTTIARQGYFDPIHVETLKRRSLAGTATPTGGNEADVLMSVITFGLLLDLFALPELGRC